MRKKKRIKRMRNMMALCFLVTALVGTISNAAYVTNVKKTLINAGTSGSVWQYKATGDNSKHASAYAYLSVGIKGPKDYVFDYGSRAVGPSTTLTAYSPTRLGKSSQMSGETDYN